jgi:hypothetical protein
MAAGAVSASTDGEDLDRPMPVVQAVGLGSDRHSPFSLPTLVNRGDVAARLAAIAAMDDGAADAPAGATHAPAGVEPSTMADAPAATAKPVADVAPRPAAVGRAAVGRAAVVAPRIDEPADIAIPRQPDAASAATEPSPTDEADATSVEAPVDATAPGVTAPDMTAAGLTAPDMTAPGVTAPEKAPPARGSARVGGSRPARGAAAVPTRAHPPATEAPHVTSYADDDWRGHIKGAGHRTDGRVYTATAEPPNAGAEPPSTAAPAPTKPPPPTTPPSAPTTTPVPLALATARIPTAPLRSASDRDDVADVPAMATAPASSAEEEESEHAPKHLSVADRLARIGVVLVIVAIFVVLFLLGPKINQWFSGH